ncbi:hypothetical protein RND81_09G178700 [Saponaria officinalis]|uniref:Uncharacterized protein n=1 Tax=Saponaria officinalis TaxID=3572 RepID=A0AAW1INP7_SAPOF
MAKMKPLSKSMSVHDFGADFNPDFSIALPYTGSPLNHTFLPKVLPLDLHRIPTAKPALSLPLLDPFSLPVVQPVSFAAFPDSYSNAFRDFHSFEGFDECDPLLSFSGNLEHDKCLPMSGNGVIESSGSLGFSTSNRDHSHEFSESSDMLDTPLDCNELDILGLQNGMSNSDHITRALSGVICYEEEEEEESDGEHLECRRTKKPNVTFRDQEDSNDMIYQEDSVYAEDEFSRERPVAQKPPKRGMCYHCHKGNRFTDKEVCLVCEAKYCRSCILRAMGSMSEGRKCLTCIGYPVDDSKRHRLGRCSRILKGLLKEEEIKQIMNNEFSCATNQFPPECIFVNGRPLRIEELMELCNCSNPPTCLNPGNYWYDRVSGFWGKEGQKPCQIISPQLNVGNQKMKRDASNGNTNILINGREITKAELWMLKSAGVQCDGNLSFWLDADGTYQEEGMNRVKGQIWGRKKTKVLCTLLALPTLESPNPRSRSRHDSDGNVHPYLEHRALCKVLLIGNDRSGTSTIYKQARALYDVPLSEEERQDIKSMIQSNLYVYLGRLLEGREQFEEDCLAIKRKGKYTESVGPSDANPEIQAKTDYSLGPKLKAFSDWVINAMVSGNLDKIFPAATRENALYVEELWKDASIQATYSRKDELGLPRVACYFLDRAVEIAKVDYEPSDLDILNAEGITSCNGLKSVEFLFPEITNEGYKDLAKQPDPVTWCQLIRVHEKSLGKKCKWLEMFEDAGIVLFCVSLTDYDEYELDHNGELQNRMLQCKKLFESIVNHPSFEETNFLLILNKFDLMEEMIEQVPLTRCDWFEDFNPVYSRHQSSRRGGNNIAPLAQRAFHYIAVKFKKLFKSLTGRKLYVCPVTALEPDNVDAALRYAREILKWENEKLSFSFNDSSLESIDVNSSSYS